MTDLTKPLKVEEMDMASWSNDKGRRANQLASLSVNSLSEKGLVRQLQDNNSARDYLEELLLRINSVLTEAGTDKTKFTVDTKLEIQKNIRGALKQNYEQKAFLKLAKEDGYEAAEEFKSSDPDDKTMDDDLKKRVEEVKKKYGTKHKYAIQPKNHSFPKQQRSYQPPAGYQFSPFPVPNQFSQPAVPSNPFGMYNNFAQQNFPQQNFPQQQLFNPMGMGFMGTQQVTGNMTRPRGKPPIDKTNSTCKACHALGHWAGDAGCPMSGFPRAPNMNRSFQVPPNQLMLAAPGTQPPPPPGTEH